MANRWSRCFHLTYLFKWLWNQHIKGNLFEEHFMSHFDNVLILHFIDFHSNFYQFFRDFRFVASYLDIFVHFGTLGQFWTIFQFLTIIIFSPILNHFLIIFNLHFVIKFWSFNFVIFLGNLWSTLGLWFNFGPFFNFCSFLCFGPFSIILWSNSDLSILSST